MRMIVIAALLPLAACGNFFDGASVDTPGVAASGTGTSRSYPIADFTAVTLAGRDDVDVRVGPAFSVRAEGDPGVLDRLKIDRDGNTLRIGRRREASSYDSGEARIHVTMPAIVAASVAGSGDMRVDRVRTTAFRAAVAGSGNLALGQLAVDDVEIAIAGSGAVAAAGTTHRLDIRLAGSGDVDAAALVAAGATLRVMGSGNVRATVKGAADVSAMGSGNVDLGPDARCSTKRMGSGEVRCGR